MDKKIALTSPIATTPTEAFLKSFPVEYDWIIADGSSGKLNLPNRKNILQYPFALQKKILGKFYDEFTHFHGAAAIRNFAHYLAYKEGYDIVFSLDYDCVMPKGYVEDHVKILGRQKNLPAVKPVNSAWVNPLNDKEWFARGFPYYARLPYKTKLMTVDKKVVLNMGLWRNIVDINGMDKVIKKAPEDVKLARPYTGVLGYMPLCGMNNAFLREVIPAYLFLPNFKIGNWDVSRHDDIWGGYILEKLVEKKGDIITYGAPVIFHERESSQPRVLSHEHYMHLLEPYFYPLVDAAVADVRKDDYRSMFADFAMNFQKHLAKSKSKMPPQYYEGFKYLGRFITFWADLFEELP